MIGFPMLEALGVGLGIGVVHTAVLSVVLFFARRNTRDRDNDVLSLMRERNDLDRRKVELLRVIAGFGAMRREDTSNE